MAASSAAVESSPRTIAERGRLLQVLGVAFGVAVIVGNTIGAGILRTPSTVAAALPSPATFLLAWLAGGGYALLGVVSLAELGVLIPRSGGQYVFAREAFGPFAGFVIGWSDWISSAASVAAISILIGEYSSAVVPAAQSHGAAVAVAVIILFSLLQWRGTRWGDQVQRGTSVLKALAFIVLIIACFVLAPSPDTAAATRAMPAGTGTAAIGIGAIVLAMQSVIYTYDGWNGMLYFSEELPDPGRQIPRAMITGVLSVIVIYVLVNLAFVYVLGMRGLAATDFAAGAAAQAIWGARGDTILRTMMLVGLLSAVNAILLFCSRILYGMSRDGLFPAWGSRVNAGGTPSITLALSAAVSIAFLLTGTFESVIAVAAFFFVLNYVSSFTAVFVFRRRMPDAPRAYRAWGYPWTTGFSLLGGTAFLIGAMLTDRRNSAVAIGLLVASYPLYAFTVRRRAR